MFRTLSLILFALALAAPLALAEDAVVTNDYAVGVDDILDISILQPEKMMTTVTVAPDGSITGLV